MDQCGPIKILMCCAATSSALFWFDIGVAYARDVPTQPTQLMDKIALENLGAALFFDDNLSKNRNQSCSTCHAPEAGFADPRNNGLDGTIGDASSLGDDGVSIGDRNAPTASYAALTPTFHMNKERQLDGRPVS